MNRPEELIKKIYEEQGQINDVFFTACGGSLVDLYPGFYFINAESETMHSHWLTAKELIVSPSKFLKKGALVILCSHGGNTNETVNAAKLAKEGGYDYFTTTLTISPLKNASWLNELGQKAGELLGVESLPSDFKKKGGYQRSIQLSKEYNLYRQNFCGCIFSKRESEERMNKQKNIEKM